MKGLMQNDLILPLPMVEHLRGGLRWWREELVSLLPRKLRQRLQFREHQLVVHFSDDAVQLTDCRHGQAESVADITPDAEGVLRREDQEQLLVLRRRGGDQVVISLAQEQVLALSFPLPMEAEKNLDEVLGYELGRHAPFKIEQVYYGYTVQERRSDERKIWVSVTVVPRKQVEPLLLMVRSWGFVPVAVTAAEMANDQGSPCSFGSQNLLPIDERGEDVGRINLTVKLLLLMSLLLTAALAAYPFVLQEMRIVDLQQQVAVVKREAVSVQSMQQDMERVASEAAYVDEKKRQYPEVLDVLNALSRLLPDDTWLERFEMKGGRIRIQGMSADASSLIELLENSPLLQGVTFDSPIVKEPRIDRFRFQVVAELTKGGGE